MSPILDLQRRLREAGRIRIGEKRPGEKFPRKLDTFRMTSPDETIIRRAADLYGGTPMPWTDAPNPPQWQVVTTTDRLEVVVPPTDMAFSSWMELWSGGGCLRRCDTVTEVITDQPCLCDPDARECVPHTRLSVMLPDLPTVGLWRIESTGWNAATELLGSVDLASAFAQRGTYLPAELRLERRESRRAGEAIKKFVVPVLDLQVSMRELTTRNAAAGLDGGNGVGEVSAPSFTPVPAALPEAPAPSITEQLQPRPRGTRKNAVVPIPSTGLEPGPVDVGMPVDTSLPTSSPEEGGDDDSPPVAPPSDGPTLPPEQFLAMEIAEALGDRSDDARHSFLADYSHGRYFSAKDVPINEIAALRAELVRRKQARALTVEDVVTPPEGEMFPDSDLEQKSARELRELCERRGITPRGTKVDMIAALRGA